MWYQCLHSQGAKKNWGPDWVKMHQCHSISLFLDVKISPLSNGLDSKIAVAPRVLLNHAILPMFSMAVLGVVP